MQPIGLSRVEDHAELAARLCADPDWEQTLVNVVAVTGEVVRGAHVAVLLRQGRRRLECAAVSDGVAHTVIRTAIDQWEGPELSTLAEEGHTCVPDTTRTDEWPSWASVAARSGVRSVCCVALQDRGRTFGTLSLYAESPHAFDVEARARARAVATHAAIALSHAQQQRTLRQAVDARHLVGLAQGVLMERHRIDADRAFSVLQRYSQDHNIKLRLIAEEIVRRRSDVRILASTAFAARA